MITAWRSLGDWVNQGKSGYLARILGNLAGIVLQGFPEVAPKPLLSPVALLCLLGFPLAGADGAPAFAQSVEQFDRGQMQPASARPALRWNYLWTDQVGITDQASLVANARLGRISVTIFNIGGGDVFCGAATVTARSGIPLPAEAWHGVSFETSDAVYCINATKPSSVVGVAAVYQ